MTRPPGARSFHGLDFDMIGRQPGLHRVTRERGLPYLEVRCLVCDMHQTVVVNCAHFSGLARVYELTGIMVWLFSMR